MGIDVIIPGALTGFNDAFQPLKNIFEFTNRGCRMAFFIGFHFQRSGRCFEIIGNGGAPCFHFLINLVLMAKNNGRLQTAVNILLNLRRPVSVITNFHYNGSGCN